MDSVLPARFTREELKTQLAAFSAYVRAAGAEGAGGAQEAEKMSEQEELQLLEGWSSLAAWGLEQLDLGDDEPVVELPPAAEAAAAAAAGAGGN